MFVRCISVNLFQNKPRHEKIRNTCSSSVSLCWDKRLYDIITFNNLADTSGFSFHREAHPEQFHCLVYSSSLVASTNWFRRFNWRHDLDKLKTKHGEHKLQVDVQEVIVFCFENELFNEFATFLNKHCLWTKLFSAEFT